MSTQIQRRRGTTTEHSSFTGAEGEITIDTTKDTVVVHDGSRAGGFPLAHENNPSFTGNVGVGIDSAATKLHIESSDSDAAKMRLGFSSTRYYDIFRGSTTNPGLLNFYGSQSGSTGYVFGGADGERMRIDTAGRLLLGTTTEGLATYGEDFTIASSGSAGITLRSGTSGRGSLYFSDAESGAGEYAGYIDYQHNGDALRFAVNGAERMRITSGGNVGIGTINPSHPITILDDQQYKGLQLKNSTTNNLILGGYTTQNKNGFIQFYKEDGSVGALLKAENNSYFAAGNFGLGHNNPVVPFHVKGTVNNPIMFETTTDKSQIRFKNSTTDNVYIGSFGGDFRILTNTTERVRITTAGDVGIGASAPADELHLVGKMRVQGVSNVLDGNYAKIYQNASSTVDYGLRLKHYDGTSDESSAGIDIGGSTSSTKGHIHFRTSNDTTGNNDTVKMTIDPDGKVGIGETDPQGILEIGGNSSSQEIRLGDGTTVGYWLTSVRANRPLPNTAIHIDDYRWGNTAVARIKALTGSDNTNKNNGLLTFETASGTATIQERMRITEDGYVGIGTTAPAVDLEVNGQCIFDSTGVSGRTVKFVKNNQPQVSWYVGTTEQLRLQCTAASNFIDNVSSKNLKVRYGTAGTATAVELDGSDGSVTFSGEVTCSENVACTKNITAQSNQIRLITTGTGGNARGIIQLVPPSTVSDASNVFYVTPAGGSGSTIQFAKNGNATFAGTINGTTVGTSDQRFKENIAPAGSQLEDVTALGKILKNFNWNDEAPVSTEVRATRQLGLIAQEVETISPSLIKTINTNTVNEEGEEINDSYKGISHDALIMKLLGAIAELSEKVAALEAAN